MGSGEGGLEDGPGEVGRDLLGLRDGLAENRRVVRLAREFGEGLGVVEAADEVGVDLLPRLDARDLAGDRLGALGIGPEGGGLALGAERFDLFG